jgi:hypothetical protein
MAPGNDRQWTVELEGRGSLLTGRIRANGRALLPTLQASRVSEALGYVEWALVDMREGDVVELELRNADSTAPSQTYKVASRAIALAWLEQTLSERNGASAESAAATDTGNAGARTSAPAGRTAPRS